MDTVSITTSRLVLNPLKEEDAERLFEYRSNPAIRRFQLFEPRTLEDARAFILASRSEGSDWCQLGIRLLDSGVLVGDLGIRLPVEQQAEVGVTVALDHQRQGIASEALVALLGHLFRVMSIYRVWASVDPRNEASMALFRRLGMRQEAHFRQSLWFKGEFADEVVFAILASEWTAG